MLLYLEKLQKQLDQKAKTLETSDYTYFQGHLRAYFQFLESQPVLRETILQLRGEHVLNASEWLENYQTTRWPYFPDDAKTQAAQCLVLLESARDGDQKQAFLAYVGQASG